MKLLIALVLYTCIAQDFKISGKINLPASEDQSLYKIKSLDIQSNDTRGIKKVINGKTFTVDVPERKDLTIKVVVEKQKEFGLPAKQFDFEEVIPKAQLKEVHEITFDVPAPVFVKESLSFEKIIAPIIILVGIVAILNLDKIQRLYSRKRD